jgi:putative spermidine/putrescine transport system permease protein/spermidine/putrescine transport system permease protein
LKGALIVVMALSLVAMYGPIAYALTLSFFPVRRGEVDWSAFSFDSYARLWHNDQIIAALANSLTVAAVAVVAALILGSSFAWYYRNSKSGWKHVQQLLIFIPFLLPPIITGLSLLIYFRDLGISRSLATVALGHLAFVLAVVYRTVLARMQALSDSLFEASYDLGANRWQTVRFILLPNIGTALFTAAILAFALSFDETLITIFLAGNQSTLPIRLWAMMRVGFTPEINALVSLVLAFTVVAALAVGGIFRRTLAETE